MGKASTWADICGIIAGSLALFGCVGALGVEIPLLTLPCSASSIADTLLQASESLGDFPAIATRVSFIISFLQSAATGDLSRIALAVSIIHALLCVGAITLAACNLWRGHRTWRSILAAALVIVDVLAIALASSGASWGLFLVARSVARGDPWAVGRGIAGLDTTISPSIGLVAAGILGVVAIVLAVLHRRAKAATNAATR